MVLLALPSVLEVYWDLALHLLPYLLTAPQCRTKSFCIALCVDALLSLWPDGVPDNDNNGNSRAKYH